MIKRYMFLIIYCYNDKHQHELKIVKRTKR